MLPGLKSSSPGKEQIRLSGRASNLKLRARMIQSIRHFFEKYDYLEVETPALVSAPAPEAHIDIIEAGDQCLQSSPELFMKRLVSAGYPKIFQICKCFRKGERGKNHVPEFTLLEWYARDMDYFRLMDECELLIGQVATDLGMEKISYHGCCISLDSQWDRISVRQAFELFAPMSLEKAVDADCYEEIMVTDIEPHLGVKKPVFLYDYPGSMAALARLKPDDGQYAERFEMYIGGLELANGFSELTDPCEQRTRFSNEQRLRHDFHKPVYPTPEKFLEALAFMPASAGIALGIDRLAMIFTDAESISEVVAFTPEEQ